MTLTFLGTGTSQGVPVIACDCPVCQSLDYRDKRTRTSVHLEIEDKSIIIDCGPDFRQQVLRERITRLDALIFTHEHRDHTAGLDEVRSFNFRQKQDMPIYAREQVLEFLKRSFEYIFSENKYPGVPRVTPIVLDGRDFDVDGITITPIEVLHYKLPVYGFRIGDLTYITDANKIEEEEFAKIKGSRVLVLNALQKKDHISHFNLEEALGLIDRLEPEQAYLTHISHSMGLHDEVDAELPENVQIAYDGLKIEI